MDRSAGVSVSTLFDIYGYMDRDGILWRLGESWEANAMLSRHHYLGPLHSGARMVIVGAPHRGEPVAAMMWKHPTSRRLPADGSWLELSRWCLTSQAGDNAGSRMHKWAVRLIREHLPEVTTLVSYSDPTHGHTGALYRACNWQWAPTWVRLRPPPSGHGDWGTGQQGIKDRWVFCVKPDARRDEVLAVDDPAAVRFWQKNATETEVRWASRSLNLSEHVQGIDVHPGPLDSVRADEAALGESGDGDVRAIHGNAPSRANVEQLRRVRAVPSQVHAVERNGGAA